jgi:hypothetical protein
MLSKDMFESWLNGRYSLTAKTAKQIAGIKRAAALTLLFIMPLPLNRN